MLVAIAFVIPVLAGLAAAGIIGGVYWWTSRDGTGELPGTTPGLPDGSGTTPDPNVPVPGDLPPTDAVVDGLIGRYDDAAFHDTQSGDSINRVVTNTLNKIAPGMGSKPSMIAGLRRLINRSTWNRQLYGEPMPNDGYAYNGIAVNRAFLPKHENGVNVMRTGYFPKRNIDENGKRIGPSTAWGDLWVPALNHEAVRNQVADPDLMLAPAWGDGTPATEPPPELFEVLKQRGETP